MSRNDSSASEQAFFSRKARDRSVILLLVGLALLVPPFAGIFQLDVRIAGIPFTALYLFLVWGMLIAGAAVLSRRLRDDLPNGGEAERKPATGE